MLMQSNRPNRELQPFLCIKMSFAKKGCTKKASKNVL
jgi:hypothetical protein